jgi:hypothetical protein
MMAYEVSIYGMLAAPFLILGFIGFLLWRSAKRSGSQSLGGPRGPR